MVILTALMAFVAGCRGAPLYSIRVEETHKDVLRVAVAVDRPLSIHEYHRIAEDELRFVLKGARRYEVPVYEVRFEYFAPVEGTVAAERVAAYIWRPDDARPVHTTFQSNTETVPP